MKKPRILPPVYLLLCLLAMAALDRFLPVAVWIHRPWSYAGVAVLLAGVMLAASAARLFVRNRTPVVPFEPSTALVLDGPYRFTRNPMYLGLLLILLGAAVLFGSVTPPLVIPFFVWGITRNFIRREEVFLEGIFGQDYLDFKERTRRWL